MTGKVDPVGKLMLVKVVATTSIAASQVCHLVQVEKLAFFIARLFQSTVRFI
jgi:hypothetical protein